uniref:SH3 domain-containing protein n=1 Tax=Electrophorus electricus TaxID=8005 RepID=A0AAY5EZ89_ELEEL
MMVLVKFQYEYTTQDGKQVSIKPNERYVLVAKTNDHWWHVRQEKEAEPFFIPAEYVMELPLDSDCMPFTPIGLLTPPSEWGGKNLPEPVPLDAQEALGMTHSILCSVKKDTEKDGHRMSTFVSPEGLYTCGLLEPELVKASAEPRDSCEDVAQVDAGGSPLPPPIEEDRPFTISPPDTFATGSPSTTEPASAHSVNSLTKSPSLDLNSDIQMLIRPGWDLKMWNLKEDSVSESTDTVKESGVEGSKDSEAEATPASPVPLSATPAMPASEQEQSHGAAPVVPATLSERYTITVYHNDYLQMPK